MKEIKILGKEKPSQIKWKKFWGGTFCNTGFGRVGAKNQVEKTPHQPASKAWVVILGLKYKAYSNSFLQNELNLFCV